MKTKLALTAFTIFCGAAAHAQSANNSFSFSSVNETKTNWVKKNEVVAIYQNPSTAGEVTVTSKTDQLLHFYIFDLEGTLTYQTILKTKEKKSITSLIKGTYMYNVFANDESIDEGKLIIK